MGDETDIESLRNAPNFDKAFIEEMIPHHQMAVMMAQMLKNTTNREEMKKLAWIFGINWSDHIWRFNLGSILS